MPFCDYFDSSNNSSGQEGEFLESGDVGELFVML